MTATVEPALTTADGRPLREALRRAERSARWRAFWLVAPLLAFILMTFAMPIAQMLWRSIENPEINAAMPRAYAAIASWNGQDTPDEAVYAAMAEDLREDAARGQAQRMGSAAARLNREKPGSISMLKGATAQAAGWAPPYKDKFLAQHKGWGDAAFWQAVRREGRPYTPAFYVMAADFEYKSDGSIGAKPEEQQIYRKLFWRTAWMSALITGLCVVLAYPIAYLLAISPLRRANLLMILVLLPFWTSLLVRTSAWIVVLQREGVLNNLLVWAGLIAPENRPQLIYNAIGTTVAMTHILLPFMILPLYSVMKTIKPSFLRAAVSLGAHPFTAWWKVYFPLTLPGLAAGAMLAFIMAIGYYITPALVGGSTGMFISNVIADNMRGTSANLKLAAALAVMLLSATLILYWLFNKLIGVDRLKFG